MFIMFIPSRIMTPAKFTPTVRTKVPRPAPAEQPVTRKETTDTVPVSNSEPQNFVDPNGSRELTVDEVCRYLSLNPGVAQFFLAADRTFDRKRIAAYIWWVDESRIVRRVERAWACGQNDNLPYEGHRADA